MENFFYKTGSANIIMSDYPDLDVIRVDNTYYMVSTTMHFFPGCVILRSYNLLDWEFCSYVYDQFDDTPAQKLEDNKGIYGKGMWAATLRYNKGNFYIAFVANDTKKSYLFTSDNIMGPWKKNVMEGFYHDMSLLFDEDDKIYVAYGNTEIHLVEMKKDLSGPVQGGINKVIVQDDREKVILGYEGTHFYKINGKYYLFFIHMPKDKIRTEACFVSDKVEGPYTGCDVLCSDLGNWNSGVAQGGIVQAPDGNWYSILFQDHGALGRIPVLVSVDFSKEIPVFGKNGIVPADVKVPDLRPEYKYESLYGNEFCNDDGSLKSYWQWNHICNKELIFFMKNELHIKTEKICKNIVQASNTLTQRTFGEECEGEVFVDGSNLKEGDFAGFCALEGEYGFIGLSKKNDGLYLIVAEHKIPYGQWSMGVFDDEEPVIKYEKKLPDSVKKIRLKMNFSLHYQQEQVVFNYFDENKKAFLQFGESVKLRYTLDQFVGVRFALFIYSTEVCGGEAVFSDFTYKKNK